ncbi:MAG: hypothetical protein AB7F59_04825 [Bdellovibrionales bacterium]
MRGSFVRYVASVLSVITFVSSFSFAYEIPQKNTVYPVSPDQTLTRGSLCSNPNTYRYPEQIAYCTRSVETSLKWQIIRMYNTKLGYHIEESKRSQYKIDHFFPLCAGGSNNVDNLWPQHVSVYTITDPLEPEVCNKMAAGRLSQKQALIYIRDAKLNLRRAPAIIATVRAL